MNRNELSKHVLYVEGAACALAAKGYLEGPISITAKGIDAYFELLASGWRPSRKIVRRVLQDKGVPRGQLDGMTDLIMSTSQSHTENDLNRCRALAGLQIAMELQDTGEFDPKELSVNACWGLLALAERGHIAIRRGFVIDGDNEDAVRWEDELQDTPSRAEFVLSRMVLILESRGLVTVRRGEIALSDKGAEEYAGVNVDRGSDENADKTVQVSDRIHSFIQRCARPGESADCVLRRLRVMVEGRTEADGIAEQP